MLAMDELPLSDALVGCLWSPNPFICFFGDSVSWDSFLVRKFSLSAPIPRLVSRVRRSPR